MIACEKEITVADPEVPELNRMFHIALAEASRNRVLAASVAAVHRATHPLRFIETSAEVGRIAVRHHIAITSAVRDRDPDAAAEAMQRQLAYLLAHAVF